MTLRTPSARQPWLHGRTWLHILFALALLGATTCLNSHSQLDRGDPGNNRLHNLAKDQIFASLPPGTEATGPLAIMPARYRAPAFEAAGWDGPAVSLTFTSSQSPASVFSFFQASAASAGWSPVNRNSLGYPETWIKTYPGGVQGKLSLIETGSAAQDGSNPFVLTASSPPAV